MAYLVSITPRAERDLAQLYEHIEAEQSNAALKWYTGLKRTILSLDHPPQRCPAAPEGAHTRQLLYGHRPHVYRVIYRVLEKGKEVEILHIRHGRQQELGRASLR